MKVTPTLAGFIRDTTFESVPERTRAWSRLALMDWLGVTIAGSREDAYRLLCSHVMEFAGPPQATLIGVGEKVDAISAAFLNGYSSHLLDFDDVHLGWAGHSSVPVYPAVVALAEWQGAGYREALTAYVLGVEVECRVGASVMPGHYARGFHATGTVGHFGAAAAAAKLLNLTPEETARALGIAATTASGLRASFGTMCKPLHAGKSAADGLRAALLARRRFSAPEDMIAAQHGFAASFSDEYHPERITDGLGERWLVDETVFKRFASCSETHALMECAKRLRDRVLPVLDRVTSVRCRIEPFSSAVAGVGVPTSGMEGKFSQAFCAALMLVRGKAGPEEFRDETVLDPLLRGLTEKITVVPWAPYGHEEASIEVELADGKVLEHQVDLRKEMPTLERLTEELSMKFRGLLVAAGFERDVDRLTEALCSFEQNQDLAAVLRMVSYPPRKLRPAEEAPSRLL